MIHWQAKAKSNRFVARLALAVVSLLPALAGAAPLANTLDASANGNSGKLAAVAPASLPANPSETTMAVTQRSPAIVSLPPAFILLVSGVTAIAVVGSRRHRKRDGEQRVL